MYYLRYVDDFILLDRSKDVLLERKKLIEEFLLQKLALSLKPESALKMVGCGADFLGYIVRPGYTLVRNRVVGNLKVKLGRFEKRIVVHGAIGRRKYSVYHLRNDTIHELRQTLASYLGHFKHASTHNLIKGLFDRYSYIKYLFALNNGYRLVALYEPPFFPNCLRSQYFWFVHKYSAYCIFFQVGKFVELYGNQAEMYGGMFGINMNKSGSRGMGSQSGFPVSMLRDCKTRAMHAYQRYIVVAERGYYSSGLKKRRITEICYFDDQTV